jgi:hypothetical protein
MKRLWTLLILLISVAHASDIGLSPPRLELSLRPGETVTETITLLTETLSEQQIQVTLGDWTLDPLGELVLLPVGSLPASAALWIAPETSDFILPARSSRDFRLSVTLPSDSALDGTYHAMVFFTVVPPQVEGDGLSVVTTTRIGLTLYLTVAGTEKSGSELIDLFQSDDTSLTFVVVNLGNTVMRLGGRLELRGEDGATRYTIAIPDLPVLRESEREVTLELPPEIAPGFYTALALIEDSRGGLLAGELPLEIR